MLCKNCQKKLTGRWKNFCCRRCGTLLYITQHPNKETGIEKKLREWLMGNGVKFVSHKSVSNISVPDFIIDKIALYADGDYWHSLPKRRWRDNRINQRLEKLGYTVLRFAESDINNKFEQVAEKINAALHEHNQRVKAEPEKTIGIVSAS